MGEANFSYIVTVHDKEALLRRVLDGVAASASRPARVIVVLDGCSDRSPAIAAEFRDTSPLDVRLVSTPDVHEILAINAAMEHIQPGYVVIVQDDVVLQEPELERRVVALDERLEGKLGYLSFRMAADVRQTRLVSRVAAAVRERNPRTLGGMLDQYNYIAHPGEVNDMPRAALYEFHPRMIGIKSPICLGPRLVATGAVLDSSLAPYCYDDAELSLRALSRGLVNGVYPVPFTTRPEWSGTMADTEGFRGRVGRRIRARNRVLVWNRHRALIQQRDRK
jgi:glycosyltransferase involved in cell wall biosynthesis